MNAATKEKMIGTLKTKADVWNRWREMFPSNPNLHGANLIDANLCDANLIGANLRDADLRGANLDFSCLDLSCKTLSTIFDEKQLIQFLFHVALPTQNNSLNIQDKDLKKLLNLKTFQKVVNKFHRVEECGIFTGTK